MMPSRAQYPIFGCSSMSRALLSVLVCVSAMAQVRASAQTGAAAVYQISGTVVNAVTGAPILRVTVAVLAEEDSHRIAAAQSDAVKDKLRSETAEAQRLDIFGAPTFVTADGELFWGNDRLEAALAWAKRTP